MVDANALRQIFSLESAAWTGVALMSLFFLRMWNGAPAMFAQWIAYRKAKSEEKIASYTRLNSENERLDARCIRLEQAETRCRAELLDVQSRLSSIEGYMAGQGRAYQEAAGVAALDRLAQKNPKKEGGEGGGK